MVKCGRFVIYHNNENVLGELDRKSCANSRARVTARTITILPPEAVKYLNFTPVVLLTFYNLQILFYEKASTFSRVSKFTLCCVTCDVISWSMLSSP